MMGLMAPFHPVNSALGILLCSCLLLPHGLLEVLASPYLRIDKIAPSMLVGITIFQAGVEVELNPGFICPDKPIVLPAAPDADAALLALRLQVSATDDLSGVDLLKHPGGSTIVTAPGMAPDVRGFKVGATPSEGMLKAWPPGRAYSLAFASADRAGNVATCAVSFVVGEAPGSVRTRSARLRRRQRRTRAIRRAKLPQPERDRLLIAGPRRLLAADDAGAIVMKVWTNSGTIPKKPPSYNVTLDRLLAYSQQSYLPLKLQVAFGFSAQISAILQPKASGAYTFELITQVFTAATGALYIAGKELIAVGVGGTGTINLVAGTTVELRLDLLDLAEQELDWWNVAVTWKGPADDSFRVIGDIAPGCPSGFVRTSVAGRCLRAIEFEKDSPYSEAVKECQAAGAIIAPVTSLQDAVDLAYTCILFNGCWVGVTQAKNQPSPAAGWTTVRSNETCPESVPSAVWAPGFPLDNNPDPGGKNTSWLEDGDADCAIVNLEPTRLGGGTLYDQPCNLMLSGAICALPEPCPGKPAVPPPPPPAVDCPASFARGYRTGVCLARLGAKNLTYSNAVAFCASKRAILAPMSNPDEAYDAVAACGQNAPGIPCWVSLTQKLNSATPDAGWQTVRNCSGSLSDIEDVHSVFSATQPGDNLNTAKEDNEFQCGDVNRIESGDVQLVEDNQCGKVLGFAVCALPNGDLCPAFPPPAPPSPPKPPPSPVIIINQPASPLPSEKKGSRSKTLAVTLGVTIPLVALFVAALAGLCFWKQKRSPVRQPTRGKPTNLLEAAAAKLESRKAREFSAQELIGATHNFDDKMLLGKGGFGTVYKGVLPDGSLIAVKRLHENTGAIDVATENLVAEVNVLSAVSHRNLVRLLGLCIDEGECALIYEFIANGSLDRVLAVGKADEVFPWDRRRKIILGTASALLYLHHQCEQKIIHRDIKPANILLDENWEPRLADFGLAKETLYNAEQVTTMLKGTPGYIAPEAWQSTQVTLKSDVYSFGMVVLVTISSKSPSYDLSATGADCVPGLVNAVLFVLEAGRLLEIVAPQMEVDEKAAAEIERFIIVALHCTQPRPEQRPSMDQVYYMLDGSADIPEISLAITREDVGPTLLGFAPGVTTSGPSYTMSDSSLSGAPTANTMAPSSMASSNGVNK